MSFVFSAKSAALTGSENAHITAASAAAVNLFSFISLPLNIDYFSKNKK